MLPGMVLQPIVENAVNYGIRDLEREGHIVLSVYRMDDNICISIMDNGVGMKQEIIDEILSGEYKPETHEEDNLSKRGGNGVGLRNVIERLNIYFNDRNNVEIVSEGKDQGTEVIISLPFNEPEE